MKRDTKIYVAGYKGLMDSKRLRNLQARGYHNPVTRTHIELYLTDQKAVGAFFEGDKSGVGFLAAAKAGSVGTNTAYPAEFIWSNLTIQSDAINAAWTSKVGCLLFLGLSCIYPRLAPQPLKDECLLTGPLEPTNPAYAWAKIAGVTADSVGPSFWL